MVIYLILMTNEMVGVLMITKKDIVYNLTLDGNEDNQFVYGCEYYGVKVNGISTISAQAWYDMTSIGINVFEYTLRLFMVYDNAINEEPKQVVRLTLEFNSDGSLIPVFDRIL